MKLTWKPRAGTAGTPVVLGDNTASTTRGTGSKAVLSYQPSFQKSAQVVASPQAEAVVTIGRGNLVTEINVAVAYEFASYGECTKFLTGLGDLIESEGILEVRHTGGGADTIEGCFTAARLLQQVGSSAVVQFNFVGGAFTRGSGNNNEVIQ